MRGVTESLAARAGVDSRALSPGIQAVSLPELLEKLARRPRSPMA